ncbi:MAG: right-handed parallel beta-helix repeat-containing protein [Candidatus Bathyarchaeota archaeon]|nr:right-handed parallel beta-helix repeat-containing protein [Candidatus Bathyarchaeota archaeon]
MKLHGLIGLILIVLCLSLISPFASLTEAQRNQGGIYIKEDGSIQGTSNIRQDGETYMFTDDFLGPLYVEKDDIVIDGAGFTVTGRYGRGIVLEGRQGVTLRNAQVKLDGGYMVDLTNASDCVIESNILTGTPEGIMFGPIGINFLHSQGIVVKNNVLTNFFYGLSLQSTSGNTITNNVLTDGVLGIDLSQADDCLFRDNRLVNCDFGVGGLSGGAYLNDLDTSNTVDGKPIYYFTNIQDQVVPTDGDTIVLANCQNIIIQDTSPKSINLFSTHNVTISNVFLSDPSTAGIELVACTNINILNSNIDGSAIGIRLTNSSDNRIVDNTIANTRTRGLTLTNSDSNVIAGNTFTGNSQAVGQIGLTPSEGNLIATNTFTDNANALTIQGATTIKDNTFQNNGVAISFSESSGSTITQNTFEGNRMALYFSSSSYNTIYRNNFLHNDRQVVDAGENGTSTLSTTATVGSGKVQLLAAYVSGVNFFPPPPLSTNYYDYGAEGNYWIDYAPSDQDHNGISDTPYTIYANNTDRYPLTKPVPIPMKSADNYVLSTPNDILTKVNETPSGSELTFTLCVFAVLGAGFAVGVGLVLYQKNQTHKPQPSI